MRNLVVFGGSSHPDLTRAVCNRLGISPGKTKLSKFSNNETSVEVHESVREKDVFIIQSGSGHVNDTLLELLILINACKIASAKRITAVIPYFPYSRQADMPFKSSAGAPLERLPSTPRPENQEAAANENVSQLLYQKLAKVAVENNGNSDDDDDGTKYRQWVARSGTLVANLLTCAGADHIISLDMHDPQFQGFFDCPFDNLISMPLMIRYIKLNIPNYQDAVIVSPDAGGAKRATAIAEKLCMDFALIHKERRQVSTQKRDLMLVGDVRGKECVLIDDICDTSYTITRAARMLRENGALKVYAIVCHAILSDSALENIEKSNIDQIVVSNSIPQNEHLQSSKIKVFDVAPLFAEAIRRIHFGESVSMLFDAQHEIV